MLFALHNLPVTFLMLLSFPFLYFYPARLLVFSRRVFLSLLALLPGSMSFSSLYSQHAKQGLACEGTQFVFYCLMNTQCFHSCFHQP